MSHFAPWLYAIFPAIYNEKQGSLDVPLSGTVYVQIDHGRGREGEGGREGVGGREREGREGRGRRGRREVI